MADPRDPAGESVYADMTLSLLACLVPCDSGVWSAQDDRGSAMTSWGAGTSAPASKVRNRDLSGAYALAASPKKPATVIVDSAAGAALGDVVEAHVTTLPFSTSCRCRIPSLRRCGGSGSHSRIAIADNQPPYRPLAVHLEDGEPHRALTSWATAEIRRRRTPRRARQSASGPPIAHRTHPQARAPTFRREMRRRGTASRIH